MRYPLKMRVLAALFSILAAWLVLDPSLALSRDLKARKAFISANPCPSTGKRSGSCPGWIVDHVKPLCVGGLDAPVNMQWQTVAAAKAKDRQEQAECRAIRKARNTAPQ